MTAAAAPAAAAARQHPNPVRRRRRGRLLSRYCKTGRACPPERHPLPPRAAAAGFIRTGLPRAGSRPSKAAAGPLAASCGSLLAHSRAPIAGARAGRFQGPAAGRRQAGRAA